LALYRQTGDTYFQSMALGNLSADYRVLGETQKALDAAQGAWRLAESNGDRHRALFARESIAAIHLQRGELSLALDGYRQTIADLQSTPYPMIAGMAWNDLGLVYRQLGDNDESLRAYRQAESAWQASGDRGGLAETLINEAETALDDGQLARATALFQQALDFDSAQHFQREQAHALGGLGRCAMAQGNWHVARIRLTVSRDLARHIDASEIETTAYQALGNLDMRQQSWMDADRNYNEAYAIAVKSHDLSGQAAALTGRAHTAQESGRLPDAQHLIERALAIVENQHAAITEPALATSYFSTQRAYYERAIDILMQLDRWRPGHGYAAAALE
ncbi:MAG: tetratricopeptide repeat protein, partial [Vulcanimicrobiaceae bacterium]